MFKRIFALLLFSILCSTEAYAQYATPGVQTEAEMLKAARIDCSKPPSVCLDNFTMKDYIYTTGLLDSTNNHVTQQLYSKNRDLIAGMKFQNYSEINTNKYTKVFGYDCHFTSANNYGSYGGVMCDVYGEQRPMDGWCSEPCTWTEYRRTNIFAVSLAKAPSNCSQGWNYQPGIGCIQVENSNRTSSSIRNSCKDGNCPNLSMGKPNQNPTEGGIDLMSGSTVDKKIDISVPFEFSRNYVSKRVNNGNLGNNWKHNYDKSIRTYTVTNQDNEKFIGSVVITQENDEEIVFTRLSATEPFIPSYKDQKDYSLIMDNISLLNTFRLKAPNGNEEIYSINGQLTEMKNRSGYKLNFSYYGNQLNKITDTYGKSIDLEYSGGTISKATSSTGDIINYSYSGAMLSSQSLNGGRTISYGYDGKNLTTKTNAKGQIVSSYAYDSLNNAIQSMNYGMNGAINIKNIVYPTSTTSSLITVTENGSTKSYYQTKYYGKKVPSTTNFKIGTQVIPKEVASYSGNLANIKDEEGNTYSYTYDVDGWLATTNRNGVVTTFTWDKINNLLLSASDSLRTTNYSYNNDGLMTEKSIISANSGTRTWSYTWGSLGKLESQTEPNGAITTYTYYSDNDADNVKGKLYKITNALGHEIIISSYDNRENPASITLANGVTKNYTYNDLGQVLTETVNGVTTNYTYDEDGLLTQSQLPNGYTINYAYDPLGRKISLTDNIGGAISYTYGDSDIPTNESVYGNSNLQLTANRVIDGLERLTEAWKSNPSEKYTYVYNSLTNFRPYSETNPRGSTQTLTYNKSLVSGESGYGRSVSTSYDIDENPTRISANSIVYTMTYNEFAEVLTSTNLNTGTDTYTYDITNKVNTKIDSLGINHVTQLDLLSRPLTIDSSGMQKVFVYDTNQIGKLTSAQNGNTLVEYTYNTIGQPLTKSQNVNGMNKNITYEYNTIGQVTKMIYPSGLEINYTYSNGLITNIDATGLGNIVQNINYQAITFSPLSWTWGNNLTRSKVLDTSGKIVSLNDGIINQSYNSDGVFNITQINDNGINKYYEYTLNASALSKMSGDVGTVKYTLGTKIERTGFTDFNAKYFSYYYIANKLDYFYDGSKSYKVTYDVKGNTLINTLGSFTYNNQNNMDSATANEQTTSYIYNAFDERVAKIGAEVNKTFMYNDSHQLIGEYEGNTGIEYIYLDSTPIATYKNGQIFFIHTDYLETPRAITNSGGSVVWKWDNIDPFGRNQPINMGIDLNLRFMGQYFDNETGLFYNYYRYYNPNTGRYMQADPIGIKGGLDTYAYVGNNPINAVDPLGLEAIVRMNKNNINIIVPVSVNRNSDLDKIASSGLSKGNLAAQYIQNMSNGNWNSKKWKYGKCNVNIDVQVSYGTEQLNKLNIVDNLTTRSGIRATVNGNKVSGNSGTLNIRHTSAIPHEMGHLMGLPDKYSGDNTPYKNWEGNIMGEVGGQVEQKNINDIVNINLNKGQIGVCGC
jgi:RHS repeat-associated protein